MTDFDRSGPFWTTWGRFGPFWDRVTFRSVGGRLGPINLDIANHVEELEMAEQQFMEVIVDMIHDVRSNFVFNDLRLVSRFVIMAMILSRLTELVIELSYSLWLDLGVWV